MRTPPAPRWRAGKAACAYVNPAAKPSGEFQVSKERCRIKSKENLLARAPLFRFHNAKVVEVRILNKISKIAFSICVSLFVIGSGTQVFSQVSLVNTGSTNDGGTAFSIVVSNNLVYLANGADGFRIYDVSDPTFPKCIGHTNDQGNLYGFAVAGNYAYVSENTDGLHIYDISDPTNPVCIGVASDGSSGGIPVAVHDHYAFLYLRSNGVGIYDVADPINPIPLAHGLIGYNSFAFLSNCLYISNPNSGHTLYGYDVSNPASPTNVYVSSGAYVWGLATSGHYLFAGTQEFIPVPGQFVSGLIAFDISNPTNPVYLGASGGLGFAGGQVVVNGNYAYWANGNYGLQVFDVSNPTGTNIIKVGEIRDGTAEAVAVSGHYAYVVNQNSGIATNGGLQIYAITPQLNASLTQTNTIVMSWPTVGPFLLQENPDLATSNWSTINQAPDAVGAKSQIVLPGPTNSMFYRLISQ